MDHHSISTRRFCVLSGLSGVAGVGSWLRSVNNTLQTYSGERGCRR